MSIVDILEIQNCVMAVTDTGYVIMWNLNEIKRINGAYIFKDNISLLPSRAALRIDPHRLTGFRRHHNTLFMYDLPDTGSINRLSMRYLTNKSYRPYGNNASKTSSPSTLLSSRRRNS